MGTLDYTDLPLPIFCPHCGNSYPWTEAKLKEGRGILEVKRISELLKIFQWIKSHRVRSIIFTVLIAGITLLGTNWTLVVENVAKVVEWLPKLW